MANVRRPGATQDLAKKIRMWEAGEYAARAYYLGLDGMQNSDAARVQLDIIARLLIETSEFTRKEKDEWTARLPSPVRSSPNAESDEVVT